MSGGTLRVTGGVTACAGPAVRLAVFEADAPRVAPLVDRSVPPLVATPVARTGEWPDVGVTVRPAGVAWLAPGLPLARAVPGAFRESATRPEPSSAVCAPGFWSLRS